MSINISDFGTLKNGEIVKLITINGKCNLKASFLNYGARVQSLVFDNYDTVLGFKDIESYENCTSYQGAIIGRYANRINNGKFTLNGKEYDIGINSNGVHLHGGFSGYDKKIWSFEISDKDEPSIKFYLKSEDGDMGYPGELDVCVEYTITDNSLIIEYNAKSSSDTIINLTNHCYFNIGGDDCLNTYLSINSNYITPLNDKMIPTGELLNVNNTPFDLRVPKRISDGLNSSHKQILLTGGFDHNFIINGEGYREFAYAYSPDTGIRLDCNSDRPAMQLYTSNCLGPEEGINKNGLPLKKWQAFCLETQSYPDSPNNSQFPSVVLKKDKIWKSKTVYSFSKM